MHIMSLTIGGILDRTTLAAMESLAIPLVQEVVFLADFRCLRCQQRVAQIMSKMNGETQSVMISVLEKKVTLTFSAADKPQAIASVLCQRISCWRKISLILRLFRSSRARQQHSTASYSSYNT